MVQVSLSTTTTFDGDLNALVEDLGTALTVSFDLDEPAPVGGLKVYIDSEVEQILNRLDLPGAIANPQVENLNLSATQTNFDNSGLAVEITEGATFATVTLNVFDNAEPDTFLPTTFDGRVDALFSLVTADQIAVADQSSITGVGDYTIDPAAASSTVIFADEASQLTDTPEPPTPEPPTSDGLQVSLFTGPGYLIEDEGTVSAHAFLATNGVIPEGGLVVSVDAPNLSEFDLESGSVEGGEIVAVRDGGFDLRMTEYTTLVNLAVADDGEVDSGETASFSLAAGDGYEVVEEYSGGTFNLIDTRSDIPRGVVVEPNDIIAVATDTAITPENPSFSATDSIYFDIGNRYLNEDGTYTYIDYNEDVDLYQVELSVGDTVTVQTSEVEGNKFGGQGLTSGLAVLDADGNRLIATSTVAQLAPPNKLFESDLNFDLNEDGTIVSPDNYLEFTAPEDGIYYFGVSGFASATSQNFGEDRSYSIETPGLGENNRITLGSYEIEIDLLTPDNPRQLGTPTPPVSNPNVTNPPTLFLNANPVTVDSEGNLTNGVVEFVEDGGNSRVSFTIKAEGEIPEEGIEFVLNSNANLFDYVSLLDQTTLPSTIGGQSLGAFYNEDGIPTGMRLLIEEPTMIVDFEAANRGFLVELFGVESLVNEFEPLETDGAEDVSFFLQPGEGYEVAPDAGTTEVTYYDSVADVPASTGGSNTVPEVGISISETQLIETEGTVTTLTFTLSEPPPAEGLTVLLDSEDNVIVGSVLSQFDVLNAEVVGGDFPIANADTSGFFFNITEQTATITFSVFDELSAGLDLPANSFQEGLLDLTFALQPQAGYTIDESASEINLTIADNPDSQIQVSLTGSTEADPESTALIEAEGTVSVHTFSLSSPPPVEGLTVSVSADSLDDFDVDAIEVQGGAIANLSNDGFDFTILEREATISLPILQDSASEGSEAANFTLEPGNTYELNAAATVATFALADTIDQVSIPTEIERNNVISQASALGLNINNSTISIDGELSGYGGTPGRFYGHSEDVDFYSLILEVGQTIALDVDGGATADSIFAGARVEDLVFPAQAENDLRTDAELRLFDANGNEVAANNDGAAPGEDFSRDPFIEYTASESGTYYVGVSQLGNRNYDPNVARSGSGWTFPEVGVFFGPYELTATLTDGDTGDGTGSGLTGTDAADTLIGTASDDLLDGLLGDDTYTGGAGADQFVFAIAQGVDTITDFEVGIDLISLGGLTPEGVKFFELSSDTLVLTASNELIGVVQGVTGLDSSVFA